MIQAKLRKVGNALVVGIPAAEVKRRGLKAGQLVAIDVQPLEVRPAIRPEVREAVEASWKRNEKGYRKLAEI